MPSKPYSPGLPSVYLDQSTLLDAYRGTWIGSQKDHRELASLIRELAETANLCLSHAHIWETAAWESEYEGMATWLDTLNIVWLRPFLDVQKSEDEHLMRGVMDLEQPAPVSVFAGSFLASFVGGITPENTSEMLACPTVRSAVCEVRASQQPTYVRPFMPHAHATLRRDREMAYAAGVSAEQLRNRIGDKHRRNIRKRANLAYGRLIADTEKRPGTVTTPQAAEKEFVRRYEMDQGVLRTTRVMEQYFQAFERETGAQTAGSKAVTKKHASGFFDITHALVGAAYCDVFNCDVFTARCLAGLRESWNMASTISHRETEEHGAFVERLRATVLQ